MSVNYYDSSTQTLTRISGGTLYAEMPLASLIPFTASENKIPNGFCLADGRALSRTMYADLFALIGTTYGSGDGSTTFNIPDLREAVPKGTGLTSKSNNHLDADGLALGEFIDDRGQKHTHTRGSMNITGSPAVMSYGRINSDYTPTGAFYTMDASYSMMAGDYSPTYPRVGFDASRSWTGTTSDPSGRSGATTEVKAVGVNWIYKISQTAVPVDIAAGVDTLIANAITEAMAIKTITPTILVAGTSVTCVRSGKAVMVHVHTDTVPVSFNTRVNLASGLPKPAGNIVPTGFNDWGGISAVVNVELSTAGVLMAVGAAGTSSTNVTVDSTFTYVTSE